MNPLDQALHTFIAESRELLANMEDSLLVLERDPNDGDTLNAIFRAIHTIKGSAGLFGLDDIVRFAHVVENVLDRARSNELVIDEELAALLLDCRDHLGYQVGEAAGDGTLEHDEVEACGQGLLVRLQRYASVAAVPVAPQAKPLIETEPRVEVVSEGAVRNAAWHISVRFGRDVLRNGMDPASFLHYLSTLGDVVSTTTLCDAMPPASEMDPESCYVGFEIDFVSEASKEAIESVFEFVRDDCELCILAPHSKIEEYVKLIQALPESKERIGEILVASGALTNAELARALAQQQSHEGERARLGEIVVQQSIVHEPVVDAALEKQKQIIERRCAESKLVRIDAQKLEELINQVGELVIASASATLLARRAGDSSLSEAMSLTGRLVEQIRDSALGLRMVEIGETFNRFRRVVRDVSRELGKDIALEISGGETELDKAVVEKINDPLVHLVRNAIDHGIEPAEVRVARGKPPQGTVRLDAFHDSGTIVIEVSDDGGGLDRERILAKAQERGLVNPGHTLGEHEILNLVFEPGLSTVEQVTNLSGRGVGMDVVRRNIQALRGTVELHSEAGAGTLVRIRLPLTLAIIDGFLIDVGSSSLVVPLDAVLECIELSAADRAACDSRRYLNLRGEVLPFLRLREVLGIEAPPVRRENVVVVQYGGRRAGLVVDRLLGEFQTVIKPLGQLFRHVRGISGSTILGSGEVALILDVPALVEQAAQLEHEEAHRASAARAPSPPVFDSTRNKPTDS